MNAQMSAWDWQLIGWGVVQLVTLVGAYFGLKADNAKTRSESKSDNEKLRADLAVGLLSERNDRLTMEAKVKADLLELITRIDQAVKDITHRVTTLESGQDEWTKTLRARTHELANDMQKLVLQVALIEHHHPRDGSK